MWIKFQYEFEWGASNHSNNSPFFICKRNEYLVFHLFFQQMFIKALLALCQALEI
jgi:hypothetical protein